MPECTLNPYTAGLMLTHSPAHAWRHIPENPKHTTYKLWRTDVILQAALMMRRDFQLYTEEFVTAPGRTNLERLASGRCMLTSEEAAHAGRCEGELMDKGGRLTNLLHPDTSPSEHSEKYRAELAPGVFYESVAHVYHTERKLLVMHHPAPVAALDQASKVLTNRLLVATAVLTMKSMRQIRGADDCPDSLAFVMQVPKWPYDAIAVAVSEDWMYLAEQQAEDILTLASECLAKDEWPLAESIPTLEPPAWAYKMRRPDSE